MEDWFGAALASPPPSAPFAALEPVVPPAQDSVAPEEEEVLLGGVIVEDEPEAAPTPPAPRPASVAPKALPPSKPPPSSSAAGPTVLIPGARKVIVHSLDGSTKRGTVRDLDLGSPTIAVETQAGVVEKLPRECLKAIFFLLAPGASAAPSEGVRVMVTLSDGRSLAGFSRDHSSPGPGIFLVPTDNRGTELIYVFRAAIKGIAKV